VQSEDLLEARMSIGPDWHLFPGDDEFVNCWGNVFFGRGLATGAFAGLRKPMAACLIPIYPAGIRYPPQLAKT
jgi:hypothetical protein